MLSSWWSLNLSWLYHHDILVHVEVDNDREEERDKEESSDDKQDNGHDAGGVKVKV